MGFAWSNRPCYSAAAVGSHGLPRGCLGGRIAQLVEQLTLNQRVVGSNPTAPTNNPGISRIYQRPRWLPAWHPDDVHTPLCLERRRAAGYGPHRIPGAPPEETQTSASAPLPVTVTERSWPRACRGRSRSVDARRRLRRARHLPPGFAVALLSAADSPTNWRWRWPAVQGRCAPGRDPGHRFIARRRAGLSRPRCGTAAASTGPKGWRDPYAEPVRTLALTPAIRAGQQAGCPDHVQESLQWAVDRGELRHAPDQERALELRAAPLCCLQSSAIMTFSCVTSSSPLTPFSRPYPEAFTPPQGRRASMSPKPLTQTAPVRI